MFIYKTLNKKINYGTINVIELHHVSGGNRSNVRKKKKIDSAENQRF